MKICEEKILIQYTDLPSPSIHCHKPSSFLVLQVS